jgi:hypothetical protein
MPSKFEKDLEGMQSAWENSEQDYKETFGGDQVPDGNYVAELSSLKMKKNDEGAIRVRRSFVILEGSQKGVVINDNMNLATDRGPTFLRRFIEQMGETSPTSLTELPEILANIVAARPTCEIRVTHSDSGFTNAWVNRLLTDDDLSGRAADDDEEPVAKKKRPVADDDDEEPAVSKKQVKAFCESWGIELEGDEDVDGMKELIAQGKFPADECSAEDVKLLKALGLAKRIK